MQQNRGTAQQLLVDLQNACRIVGSISRFDNKTKSNIEFCYLTRSGGKLGTKRLNTRFPYTIHTYGFNVKLKKAYIENSDC